MNSLTAEFGVGATTWIDSLVVDWPSGTRQAIVGVNVDNHKQLTEPTGPVICGDADSNGNINVADAVYIINYVFKGGPAPNPLCAADSDHDGNVNISDAVNIINFVFKGGPPPDPNCCED